ncbi:response regulator transcription factor [Xylanibacter muris]|uniref:Response regulator transcription factor n=1 Tax=Xylanibacter muris TaxID=2736290 RepID=A0ABX2AMA2_9BACT|nr:response regulator transcription factor [Xylanibacter muris]NPD92356.1 response regulator transcription factor [Xylanibacter muris]
MDEYRILVVEDEETLCEALQLNLELEGYAVDVANSAEEALGMDITRYSLILLDVMMGEMNGFKMARILKGRPETAGIPVIFCTARDSEDDMVAGFNIGADDYISKPYSIRNVLVRVKAVLKRVYCSADKGNDKNLMAYEGLSLDLSLKRCTVDGNEVRLTKKEFELLCMLLTNRGRIFSRSEILSKVWPSEVVVVDRVVDVNITRLRSKVGRYGNHIVTRVGYGYGFKG